VLSLTTGNVQNSFFKAKYDDAVDGESSDIGHLTHSSKAWFEITL